MCKPSDRHNKFKNTKIFIQKKIYFVPAFYRPQRSWGKVIFSVACVMNSVQGGSALLHAGIPPGKGDPPSRETVRQGDPPWQGDPPSRETPRQGDTPSARRHPFGKETPLRQGEPPTIVHTGIYGQRAGSMHLGYSH